MARSASSAPLSRKMFQHFAVITVVITAAIAVFADGQGENVLGKVVAAQESQAELAIAQTVPKRGKPVSVLNGKIHDSRTSRVPPSFEVDNGDSGYGQPMDSANGSGGGSYGGYARPTPRFPAPASVAPVGATQQIGPSVPGTPVTRRKPSSQERAELEAASLARSGDSGED